MTDPRFRPGALAFAIAVVFAVAGIDNGAAQTLNFGAGDSDQPIEIHADDGIEWQQENLLFLARGNARAIRGDVTVFGDELRAYYREKSEGGSEIHRLDAIGNVRILSTTQEGSGDQAIYDVDNAVLILTGSKPRFRSGGDQIVADRQIEYWEQKQMAVARGNASATREDRTLGAETLSAYFRKDAAGKNTVFRIDAFEKVRIRTATETATGDRGVYNVESGIATLTGSVKVERENNVLTGCRTEVNMKTNVSKMFACAEDRVRGVLTPGDARKSQPAKSPKQVKSQ